jgi:hypothetical protein
MLRRPGQTRRREGGVAEHQLHNEEAAAGDPDLAHMLTHVHTHPSELASSPPALSPTGKPHTHPHHVTHPQLTLRLPLLSFSPSYLTVACNGQLIKSGNCLRDMGHAVGHKDSDDLFACWTVTIQLLLGPSKMWSNRDSKMVENTEMVRPVRQVGQLSLVLSSSLSF